MRGQMGGEPIAVLGTALHMPFGIDSADKLFEVVRWVQPVLYPAGRGLIGSALCVCREKRQLSQDMVEAGRYTDRDFQRGREQAWKLQNPYAFCSTFQQAMSFDTAFFQFSRECLPPWHQHLHRHDDDESSRSPHDVATMNLVIRIVIMISRNQICNRHNQDHHHR